MIGNRSMLDSVEQMVAWSGGFVMRLLGPALVIALYAIVVLHIYAYFTVITPLLKRRIGTELGIIWIVVGLALVYNIVFNHFFAVVLKPGGPKETQMTE